MLLRSVTCGFWRGDFAIFWLKCLTGNGALQREFWSMGTSKPSCLFPRPGFHHIHPLFLSLPFRRGGLSQSSPCSNSTPHTHTHTHNTHTHGFHLMSRLVPRQNWWWWAKETGKNSSGRLAGLGLWQQAANSFISCFAEYKSAETF